MAWGGGSGDGGSQRSERSHQPREPQVVVVVREGGARFIQNATPHHQRGLCEKPAVCP